MAKREQGVKEQLGRAKNKIKKLESEKAALRSLAVTLEAAAVREGPIGRVVGHVDSFAVSEAEKRFEVMLEKTVDRIATVVAVAVTRALEAVDERRRAEGRIVVSGTGGPSQESIGEGEPGDDHDKGAPPVEWVERSREAPR